MSIIDRDWVEKAIVEHSRLNQSVIAIIKSSLTVRGISFLTVEGRVKTSDGIVNKIRRKKYKDAESQMTDISGVRVIVYFESDVARVSEVVSKCFRVDEDNSLDKSSLLSVDRIGYRSVHYVCDIGDERAALPEFEGMKGLKFEIQVRTVLQHAWAEISHDRSYKFSGQLPKEIERDLFLYAGLLEVADKGFDKISKSIDEYGQQIKSADFFEGKDIDSISLVSFVESWCERNGVGLRSVENKRGFSDLIHELNMFGISNLEDLSKIIPVDYAEKVKAHGEMTTIYGHVRNWMLIKDWRRFLKDVNFNWSMSSDEDIGVLEKYIVEDRVDFLTEFSSRHEF